MTIQEFFEKYPSVAIAFSGGVDLAYLLYAAITYGHDVTAYYVKSEFQPQFELDGICGFNTEWRSCEILKNHNCV